MELRLLFKCKLNQLLRIKTYNNLIVYLITYHLCKMTNRVFNCLKNKYNYNIKMIYFLKTSFKINRIKMY